LAISGPDIQEARELAEQFAQRLRDSQKLTDVAVNLDSQLRTRLDVAIDRTRAAALGLKPQEIADAVELHTGSLAVGATDRAGPRWYVSVPSDGQLRSPADGIKQIQLRNAQGQMVPLGTVVGLRTIAAPAAIHRLDGKPMVRVTANPAADETPTAAWALCELTLDQLLKEPGRPAGYRLTWLNGRDEK
jgi:multidrug efflux pump subunit AcrB